MHAIVSLIVITAAIIFVILLLHTYINDNI